jgi:iron complex outermembrane receptor protein
VLQNDPSVRTTLGLRQFLGTVRHPRLPALSAMIFPSTGCIGVTPRQLVSPELYDSVQILNGANAFLNGAAPGGSAIGGGVNLLVQARRGHAR